MSSVIKLYSLVPSHVFCRSLPHGIRSNLTDICLFTKDEPNLTPEQTERFYKKLLNKHGVKNISQVGAGYFQDKRLDSIEVISNVFLYYLVCVSLLGFFLTVPLACGSSWARRSNLCHSSNPQCCSDNAGAVTQRASQELCQWLLYLEGFSIVLLLSASRASWICL